MARNTTGFFAVHKQQCKQALTDMMRRPLGNFLTLAVLAFALTLPTTFYLFAKNLVLVGQAWQNPTQLTLYLSPASKGTAAENLRDELAKWPEIASVDYISPQQGMEEFRQQAGFEQALSLLDDNPLPGVLVVEPGAQWQQPEQATQLASRLRSQAMIDEVRLDSDWLQRLVAIKQLVVTLAMVISGLMLMAVFLIVGNTLRLQVLNQRDEVQVMKLVGATDSFILRPFLYTGVWYGVIGGAVACLLTLVITLLLDSAVTSLAGLYDSRFRLVGLGWDESLILLMLAAFLGLLAARLSAARHLKEIEPV
ncbi:MULTISPECIES: permease-like cell division protein FtsX [Photobacterium]|uniref:Cell division protein FtsX n=1 Tax=Photobacterium ganghwense TaxID=320778 RepID=A0A0J1H1T5_9GAMM|nr:MULTISPECIES: permease-like cell division protein FtsX [Photobacterium]KLV05748.1 cell division protein FtsX [Photobacterium ganghwense]MBV1843397.1 permease-like cell division protein FtsX [Photobacterium ganghwense]PSU06286.1 cell division protein FtsX [Photobacterium ganghwense]QSV14189.1 permease-like cell division protein FtsX [Photobacterium ganghwense]